MNVVMFAPEDLNLVKGSPQVRRRFIDMEIGQISPVYLHDLSQYQKIFNNEIIYLKRCKGKVNMMKPCLMYLHEQFIEHGAKIIAKTI